VSPLAEIFRDPWLVDCSDNLRARLREFSRGRWELVRKLVELRTDVPLT